MIDRTLKPASPPSGEPGAVLLESERLLMRRYLPTDAPAMAIAANHPEVTTNMRDRFPSPYTLADAESFIGSQKYDNLYPENLGIFVKPGTAGNPSAEPVFIGGLGIMPQGDVNYRTWEIGYWLTPSAWGKGYATETVKTFIAYCFTTWPRLNRIEGLAFSRNTQSRSVLKKCGLIEEGTKRGSSEKRGELLDEIIHSIIRSDFERS